MLMMRENSKWYISIGPSQSDCSLGETGQKQNQTFGRILMVQQGISLVPNLNTKRL